MSSIILIWLISNKKEARIKGKVLKCCAYVGPSKEINKGRNSLWNLA